MKKLYRFRWDCGRQGTLRGMFVAEDAKVQAALGERIYFGEVLGKHSEVCGTLAKEDLEEITDDQDFIEKFEKLIGGSGYNPLDYLPEKTEGD